MSDDMPRSILGVLDSARRIADPRSDQTSDAVGSKEDDSEQYGGCRVSRRPQMMLSFRKCSGRVDVLPYSMLAHIRSDDTDRNLRLSFPQGEVVIEGQCLTRLFHYLCEHRVLEISESDRAEALSTRTGIVVLAITLGLRES